MLLYAVLFLRSLNASSATSFAQETELLTISAVSLFSLNVSGTTAFIQAAELSYYTSGVGVTVSVGATGSVDAAFWEGRASSTMMYGIPIIIKSETNSEISIFFISKPPTKTNYIFNI
ncbi:MAG: hypothetical protein PUF08_00830 [Clostridiales bacterium]|nr:hypothetical protein [Clostridiales bacterium]